MGDLVARLGPPLAFLGEQTWRSFAIAGPVQENNCTGTIVSPGSVNGGICWQLEWNHLSALLS